MRITVRCAGLSVAKQSADDRQAMTTGGTHRGEGMPQIMQSHVLEARMVTHPTSYFIDSSEPSSGARACDYERIANDAWKIGEDLRGRRA